MTNQPTRVRLGSVCDINPETLTDSTDRDFRFAYVDLSCVETGRITLPRQMISFAESSPRARRKIKEGDVLLSTVRPNLQGFAIVEKEHASAIASTGFAVLRVKPDADSSYVYQTLFFAPVMKQMTDSVAGSNYPAITASIVAGLLIPIFPLAEQRAIARLLSSWDRGMRQLTDLIAAKLRFKQDLMQQLLTGKKRLSTGQIRGRAEPPITDSSEESLVSLEVEFGITGKSFQEGIPTVSECPPGWRQHHFRDVLEVFERPADIHDDVTYQLVTAKRYRGGIVPREQLRGDHIMTKTQFFVASGDFLISKRQIIHGACGMVPAYLNGAVVSNEYACLRPSSHLDPDFLQYLAHSRYFQQTCFHASVGVALEKMIFRLDQWLKHPVNLPPLEDQKRIAHCLSTMDREILLLARQRRLLKKQKMGLMQKLLTGEVRARQ